MKNTKDKILKTAERLYNQRGLESVSIRGIASEMGISHGNLMYHFENKEILTKALLHKNLSQFEAVSQKNEFTNEWMEFCIKHRWIWCGKRELKNMDMYESLKPLEVVELSLWEKAKPHIHPETMMWLTEAWLMRIPIDQKSGFEKHIASFENVLSELDMLVNSMKSRPIKPSSRKKVKPKDEDQQAAQGSLF